MACSLGGAWVTWLFPELGFYPPPIDADASSGTHGCFCPPDPGAFQQSKVGRVWTWGQEPRVQALTLTFNSGCDRRKSPVPSASLLHLLNGYPAPGSLQVEKGWAGSSGWHPLPLKTGLLVTVWPGLWVTGDLHPHPLTPCLKLGHTSMPLLKLFPLPE